MSRFLTLITVIIILLCSVHESECRTLTALELKKEVVSALEKKSAANGFELLVKSVSGLGNLEITQGKTDIEIVAPINFSAKRFTASVIVRVDGVVVKNIPVVCVVEEWGDFAVAAREIERGEIISAEMLTLERKARGNSMERQLISIDEPVGKKVKRRIRKSENVYSRDFEKVIVMKQGQLVTILAENDLIRLTATAKTKGGGGVGDIVTVQNVSSNVELSGRIVDAKTVKVDF